jgi:hypothetical protein
MSRRSAARGSRPGTRSRAGAGSHVGAGSKASKLAPRWPDRLAALVHGRRRGGRRLRRIRLALATALLVTAGTLAALPDRVSGDVTAVALTKDLPAGAVLSRSALRAVAVRELPDGALRDPAAVVGRTLAAPVRRGELVTDVRLVAPDGPDPGPGRAAVPIHPADGATVDLLSPGMHVVIVTVTDDLGGHRADPTVLARDAVVLSVGGSASTDRATGRVVLVGVPRADADRLAAAALGSDLAIRFG